MRPSRRPGARGRPLRASRALALFLVALRALVGIAAFQLSEIAHFGADLAADAGVLVHPPDADDDRENEPGHDCPPGCPKCHHVHSTNAALIPRMLPSGAPRTMFDGIVVDFPPVAGAPSGPPLSSLFRPPRTTLSLT